MPASVFAPLCCGCPGLAFRDITPALARLRAVKDEEEITLIREAVALCDLGQELVNRHAQPGITEIELFAEVHIGMEAKAGGRLPFLADSRFRPAHGGDRRTAVLA